MMAQSEEEFRISFPLEKDSLARMLIIPNPNYIKGKFLVQILFHGKINLMIALLASSFSLSSVR